MRRVPRGERRLVVPPAPLRAVRPHRLLRLVAEPARERPRQRRWATRSSRASSPARTGSGRTPRRPTSRAAPSSPRRSSHPPEQPVAGPGRRRAARLAAAPQLSRRSRPGRLAASLPGPDGMIRRCRVSVSGRRFDRDDRGRLRADRGRVRRRLRRPLQPRLPGGHRASTRSYGRALVAARADPLPRLLRRVPARDRCRCSSLPALVWNAHYVLVLQAAG